MSHLSKTDTLVVAWRRAIRIGAGGAVVAFFVAAAIYQRMPSHEAKITGTVVLAGAVGGFVAVYTFFICVFHRRWLLGFVAASIGLILPLAGVYGLLAVLRIPAKDAQFWVALPAGLIGEAIFTIVKPFLFRGVRTPN
jgi:hypothetical protein